MELNGTLIQFPLSELLSMIGSSMVTGMLEVSGEAETGQVYTRSGQLTHACLGELRGQAALERMVELRAARFRFVGGVRHNEHTLWGDPWLTVGLVLRHERLMQRIRSSIPTMTSIPMLRVEGGAHGVKLPAAAWPVIAAINGERTVSEIAAWLGYDRHDLALALCWLAERGLLAVRPPRRAARIQPLPLLERAVAR